MQLDIQTYKHLQMPKRNVVRNDPGPTCTPSLSITLELEWVPNPSRRPGPDEKLAENKPIT